MERMDEYFCTITFKLLGWAPKTSLDEELRKTIEYWRNICK